VSDLKEKVAALIESDIRPALQGHGGDCELIDVAPGGVVKLRLQGACAGCPGARMTLRMGVERHLKERLPEVTEVIGVD
jgi:Fe-S cluster biogenesis protein NfuA